MEKARKAIRTFFLLRGLSLSLQGLKETCLPLSNPDSFVQCGDVLDLNNSDLLAVTVVLKDGTRQRRFLVVDLMQIILIGELRSLIEMDLFDVFLTPQSLTATDWAGGSPSSPGSCRTWR